MATKNYREDTKRKTIDPKTLRKGAPLVEEKRVVYGKKESTKSGYRLGVYLGKTFETFQETILAGAHTDVTYHEKKTKTVRVINGSGVLAIVENPTEPKESWVINQRSLLTGDNIELAPGKAYKIATDAVDLDLVIVQEAKYDTKLEILETSTDMYQVDEEVLREIPRSDIISNNYGIPARQPTKAAMQQAQRNPQPMPTMPASESINKDPMAELRALEQEG